MQGHEGLHPAPLAGVNHPQALDHYRRWEIYPEGLLEVLRWLGRYGKPIIITENGICTDDDDQRVRFIRAHLEIQERQVRPSARFLGQVARTGTLPPAGEAP